MEINIFVVKLLVPAFLHLLRHVVYGTMWQKKNRGKVLIQLKNEVCDLLVITNNK